MNTLRNYIDTDKQDIVSLLSILGVRKDSGYAKFGSAEAPFMHTVILEEDGIFQGFGSLWTKDLHDKRLYVNEYHLEDENCAEGLALLAKKLFDTRDEKFPQLKFQAAYPSHLEKHLDFYLSNGFKEVMRTYSVECVINELQLAHEEIRSVNVTVESFESSTKYPDRKSEILDRLVENYFSSHPHNPPREMDRGFWNEYYLGSDILPEYCFIITQNGNVSGVLLSRKTEKLNTMFVEVVIFQETAEEIKVGVNILIAAFLQKVKDENKFDLVTFELDDADPSSREVLEWLNIKQRTQPSDILITLQEV